MDGNAGNRGTDVSRLNVAPFLMPDRRRGYAAMSGWRALSAEAWLAWWGGISAAAWILVNLAGLRAALRMRRLRDLAPPAPARWPRLTVVVAARDEEATLGAALASVLAADYPDLEVVVVNDRSSDATGAVAEALAARDPRVRAIHVDRLPEGWLGKVHALHVGTEAATGAWLLYTDADVHLGTGALRRAVGFALERGLDHFAVAPEVRVPGFWQEVATNAFATGFMLGTRAVDVERPGPTPFVGVGAFNLVRRAALDRTPGFAWLRMEVVDDIGLGMMLKHAGARASFALGLGEVEIEWYGSLRGMMRGLEKNMFGGFARYSYVRVLAILAFVAVFLPGPLVALLQPGSAVARGLGIATAALVLVSATVLKARTGRRLLPLLLAPAGFAALAWSLARSAYRCRRQGGVVWRGTFYPLARLREGLRVRL